MYMTEVAIVALFGGGCSSVTAAVAGYLWYKKCDRHDNVGDCNDMDACQWDTYAQTPKCISIDDNLTQGPTQPNGSGPTGVTNCNSISTQTLCNSNSACQWNTYGTNCISRTMTLTPAPACSTYDGSWSECEPYFDRCQYDWYAPVGQPKCIPIGQALTPAPSCSTYASSFICEQHTDRCHWDPYNAAGSRCVPLATALTPAPPTGVCSVRTATENDYYIQNMTAWAGDGMLTIATTKCNQRTTEPACTSTSDNVFGDNDGITWDLYTQGYRDTKYNDVCKWVTS